VRLYRTGVSLERISAPAYTIAEVTKALEGLSRCLLFSPNFTSVYRVLNRILNSQNLALCICIRNAKKDRTRRKCIIDVALDLRPSIKSSNRLAIAAMRPTKNRKSKGGFALVAAETH
jgi:hypothetical protein